MSDLFFDHALLPGGWARDVRLTIDGSGWITTIEDETTPRGATHRPGYAVPGVPNVHSHAFQRALVGLAERGSTHGDSFWGWRQTMYDFLGALGPDDVQAIATQLFSELLTQGFTSVVEFHYLRNDPEGRPYDDPVEMARRVLAAAQETGLGITILPTVYRSSDFGGQAPVEGQRRFVASIEEFVGDVAVLGAELGRGDARVGLALHSLRAVPEAEVNVVVAAARSMDPSLPVHIHVAEQLREVEGCLAWSGARPVEWLLDHAPVDEHWSLVHATHVTTAEVAAIASSGACVALCPMTEANLGDGVFPLEELLAARGRYAVGTDSHVSRSPAAELRMLEYGQRLVSHARNVAPGPHDRSTGRALLEAAWAGGAAATGRRVGRLAPGYRADVVLLDPDHPSLVGRSEDDVLDSWVFGTDESPVRDVFVGGTWVVEAGVHRRSEAAALSYRAVAERLAGETPQLQLDFRGGE
ncbi:MAG: formimidoylglutamate deiminase [Gemmatimonadota bacterium]